MITIHDVEQGSPAWHALRDKLYTGSNADKLLAHPEAVKIVDGVVSAYALTEASGFAGNFYTKRGHLLEDQAIDLYRRLTGHEVSRPGFVTNSKYPQCGYSPDGHDDTLGKPLEVKAFDKEKHLKLIKEPTFKVLAQMHFGCFIWGKRKGARLLAYNPYFAKKVVNDAPNPDYNPAIALVIIDIPYKRNTHSKLNRILGGSEHARKT